MRISDWSSDVCSSDLANESAGIIGIGGDAGAVAEQRAAGAARRRIDGNDADRPPSAPQLANERAEQGRLADARRPGEAYHMGPRTAIGRVPPPTGRASRRESVCKYV